MFCVLSALNIQNVQAENTNDTFVVTGNFATVFEMPDFASEKMITIKHNTEIKLEIENSKPKEYNAGTYVFYKVIEYQNLEGYIFADLVTPKQNVITSIPNFNGQTNSKCNVYFLQDNNFVESDITLDDNQRIFLYQGFNSKKEYNAIKEAKKLGIKVVGLVDTNCSPEDVDYPIPGNDDAIRAVKLIADVMANAVIEGRQGEDAIMPIGSEEENDEDVTDMEQVVENAGE